MVFLLSGEVGSDCAEMKMQKQDLTDTRLAVVSSHHVDFDKKLGLK